MSKILTVKLNTTGVKHCKYICTNYSHRFQQNRLIFLIGANRPGAKRLRGRNDQGRNDQGRNAAGAKRLGGELDLGRNDSDSRDGPDVSQNFKEIVITFLFFKISL